MTGFKSATSYAQALGAIVSNMIRLTILLLTIGTCVYGQDSTLVKETCNKIHGLTDQTDVMGQINIVSDQSIKYLAPLLNDVPREKRVKATYTFQYRLNRELKRTCKNFVFQKIPIPQRVIDLEDKLTRSQIDSIGNICSELSKTKNIYVYVVTIDDYFPDSDITDFSNRNREYWGHELSSEKGTILLSVSTTNRQMRISTGDTSMKYLTDEKCSEINKTMVPYFKTGDYFKGIVKGLEGIKKSL